MPEPCGTVAIVLHSHIPYVLGHNQLEEEWLFEAVAESYLPLLYGFRRLLYPLFQDLDPRLFWSQPEPPGLPERCGSRSPDQVSPANPADGTDPHDG